MLNTTRSTECIVNPKKTQDKVDSNSVVGNNMISGGEVTNQINLTKWKNQAKTTKSKTLTKSKNCDFPLYFRNMEAKSGFFIFKARLASFIKTYN